MTKDTRKFVSVCSVCAHGKSFHQPSAWVAASAVHPLLSLVSYSSGLGLWPYTLEGNIVILVIIDCFSKSVHDVFLPKLPSALETVHLLIGHIFRPHGIPQDIVLEDLSFHHRFGGNSVSQWVQPLFVVPLFTTLFPGVPRIPCIESAHNSLTCSSTGMSPFMCLSFFPEQVEAVACWCSPFPFPAYRSGQMVLVSSCDRPLELESRMLSPH